jgi:hypothetical protein
MVGVAAVTVMVAASAFIATSRIDRAEVQPVKVEVIPSYDYFVILRESVDRETRIPVPDTQVDVVVPPGVQIHMIKCDAPHARTWSVEWTIISAESCWAVKVMPASHADDMRARGTTNVRAFEEGPRRGRLNMDKDLGVAAFFVWPADESPAPPLESILAQR